MRKFRFSLDTLLFLRTEKEQESQIALAKVVRELNNVESQIEKASELGSMAFDQPLLTIDDMKIRERLWIKSVNDQKKLGVVRKDIESRMSEVRNVYLEAHKNKEILVKLREKKFRQWKRNVKKQEFKQLDEVAKNITGVSQ